MTPVGKMLRGLLGSSPKDAVAVRAYGKLPMTPEYRRLHCERGSAPIFVECNDTGWAHLMRLDYRANIR